VPRLSVSDLATLPVTHEAVVPEEWLDEMGHMNVMWYTHLFSCSTRGFFQCYGMTDDYLRKNQAGAFALEAHIRYLSELHVGRRVTVRTRAVARSDKRFHTIHFIVNEDDNAVAASGEFVGAHIDMTLRRMSPIPAEIGDAFDQIVKEHSQLEWEPPVSGTMKS
jgi:acyl-CoA thioester hydrolase